MLLGIWKNFEELEENISLDELGALLKSARKQEHYRRKAAAALKGIEYPDFEEDTAGELVTAEDVKRRAEAKLRGVPEEALVYGELGFSYTEE